MRTKCEFAALAPMTAFGALRMPFIATIGNFLFRPPHLTCQRLCLSFNQLHYSSQSVLISEASVKEPLILGHLGPMVAEVTEQEANLV